MSHAPVIILSFIAAGMACGTAPATKPPGEVAGGIGAPCRKDTDCISGASCEYYACDFVSPCSAQITGPEGQLTRTFHHSPDGRLLGFTERAGDQVVDREVWTWLGERQVSVEMGFGTSSAPSMVSVLEKDDHGGRRRTTGADGYHDATTFVWSDDWSCRAPRIEVQVADSPIHGMRWTCDAEGDPVLLEYLDADGSVVSSTSSVFEQHRLAARIPSTDGKPRRTTYQRDARGALIGMVVDVDGSIEQAEVYDLGCWVVEGGRVHYRP